jgi:hypothetical protein
MTMKLGSTASATRGFAVRQALPVSVPSHADSCASRQAFDHLACDFVENYHLATLSNETAARLLGFGNAVEPYRFALSVNLNPKNCVRWFRRQFAHEEISVFEQCDNDIKVLCQNYGFCDHFEPLAGFLPDGRRGPK